MSYKGTSYYDMAIDGGAVGEEEREQLAREAERLHYESIFGEQKQEQLEEEREEMGNGIGRVYTEQERFNFSYKDTKGGHNNLTFRFFIRKNIFGKTIDYYATTRKVFPLCGSVQVAVYSADVNFSGSAYSYCVTGEDFNKTEGMKIALERLMKSESISGEKHRPLRKAIWKAFFDFIGERKLEWE